MTQVTSSCLSVLTRGALLSPELLLSISDLLLFVAMIFIMNRFSLSFFFSLTFLFIFSSFSLRPLFLISSFLFSFLFHYFSLLLPSSLFSFIFRHSRSFSLYISPPFAFFLHVFHFYSTCSYIFFAASCSYIVPILSFSSVYFIFNVFLPPLFSLHLSVIFPYISHHFLHHTFHFHSSVYFMFRFLIFFRFPPLLFTLFHLFFIFSTPFFYFFLQIFLLLSST